MGEYNSSSPNSDTHDRSNDVTLYIPGHFPSLATLHRAMFAATNVTAVGGKRKEDCPTPEEASMKRSKGKQALGPEDVDVHSLNMLPSPSVIQNVVASSTSGQLHSSQVRDVMPWQGDDWVVDEQLLGSIPTAVTTPIPVRFPAALVSGERIGHGTQEESSWLLGLVMHSYVRSDKCELMYVILMDDGREVHLPCGEVDRIVLLKQYETADGLLPRTEESDLHSEGGHPSSLEGGYESPTSFDSFYSTLLRSCDDGNENVDENVEHSSAPQAYGGGGEEGILLEVAADHVSSPAMWTADLRGFDEFFADVLVDVVRSVPVGAAHDNNNEETMRCEQSREPPLQREGPLNAQGSCSHKFFPVMHCYSASTSVPVCGERLLCTREFENLNLPRPMLPSVRNGSMRTHSNVPASSSGGSFQRNLRTPPLSTAIDSGRGRLPVEPVVPEWSIPVGAAPEVSPAGARRRPRNGRLSMAAQRLAFLAEFSEDNWSTQHSAFVNPVPAFARPTAGPSFRMLRMPSKTSLFGRFWSDVTLDRICANTNRYASEMHARRNVPVGGRNWWRLDRAELKAFIAVNMLMGIKRLPNHRSYWNRSNEFMYCPSISSIMTSRRYEDITRCLHVADDSVQVVVGTNIEIDKLRKMHWLITELQNKFKLNWQLHQEVTVDETMIPYKGSYCPVRQYMPRKPTRWGVKVWCLADVRQKYVYDFQIYTGSFLRQSLTGGLTADAKKPDEVVLQLMEGLHGQAHMVCTDNYFTSVKLLQELRAVGTFGVGTVRSNRLGLPKALLDLKSLSKEPQGSLLWRLHARSGIAAVVFVDRKAVLMLSTYYPPVPAAGDVWPTVPRRVEGIVRNLETSPVHKAYSDFMRGVDVADHLRGSYSTQTRSHKWWHKIFFYLLDTSMVNCYILNKVALEQFGKDAVTHLEFQFQLADELSRPWRVQRGAVSQFRLAVPRVHGLVRSATRRKCRFCRGPVRTNLMCPQCGGVHLHAGDCYQRSHYVLRR